jgi:hypothetical protein
MHTSVLHEVDLGAPVPRKDIRMRNHVKGFPPLFVGLSQRLEFETGKRGAMKKDRKMFLGREIMFNVQQAVTCELSLLLLGGRQICREPKETEE